MRPTASLVAIMALVVGLPDDGGAISRRKECKQACGAAIEACVAAGGKRKRCKRQVLKQCRREGVAFCAATTTTTTFGSGTTSSTTTTTPGGRGTTTTLGENVHGCTPQNAFDSTGDTSNRTTTFGNNFQYAPKCRRIKVGQVVQYVGQLSTHPLVGGEIVGGSEVPDPSSPITTTPNTAPTIRNVTFPNAGVFPFYCDEHGALYGMTGVVFVEP
jgi:plastocyanin